MIATEAIERAVILVRKYRIYVFVPIFILAAFIYVANSHTQYKVTTRIVLNDRSPNNVINDLGSDGFVRKVVGQLPLQVSYYDADSPRDEVYGNLLKVKLLLDRPIVIDGETRLYLNYDGSGPVAVTHIDTTAYYDFNKPVHESYGDFRLISTAKDAHSPVSYIVILRNPVDVFAEYNSNLHFEANNADGSVMISILTGSPKKGVDFLNKMIDMYHSDGTNGSHYAGINTLTTRRSHLIILEKPENNIEQASISPFWIYLFATVTGLLIPVASSGIKQWRKGTRRIPAFSFHKFTGRMQQHIPVKQLD